MTFWRVVGEMNETRRKEKRIAKKLENDDKKTDEMDRKECRKMMKTNKGRRWKMKKNVGWGVCMKQFICGARPSTTQSGSNLWHQLQDISCSTRSIVIENPQTSRIWSLHCASLRLGGILMSALTD